MLGVKFVFLGICSMFIFSGCASKNKQAIAKIEKDPVLIEQQNKQDQDVAFKAKLLLDTIQFIK